MPKAKLKSKTTSNRQAQRRLRVQRVVGYAPSHCNVDQLCRITRDHFDAGDFAVMTDGEVVWLSEQKMGHERSKHIEIPRPIFNKLIRWYLRPQVAVRS